jgi:hypothetical protein
MTATRLQESSSDSDSPAPAVGVHHHEQDLAVRLDHGVLGGDEHVGVLRELPHMLDEGAGHVPLRVHDDAGRAAPGPGDAAHAHRGADGVQIRVLVAHDENCGGVGHQLAEGVCHDAGADLCPLFEFGAPAAVELEVVFVFDDGLVAAAGEGHLHAQGGEAEILVQGVAVLADADGQGGAHPVGGDDLPRPVQDGELAVDKPLQIPLLKQEDVAVPVVLAEVAAAAAGPVVDPVVEGGEERGLFLVAHGV